jgi:hypothetical protein
MQSNMDYPESNDVFLNGGQLIPTANNLHMMQRNWYNLQKE